MVIHFAASRRQRVVILTGVVTAHVALLLLVLALREAPVNPVKAGSLQLVSLSLPVPAASKPPPPALPSKLADTRKTLAAPTLSADVDSQTRDAPAGACAPLDVVSAALVADAEAVAAAQTTPLEARSITDAVTIWNGGWVEMSNPPASPLAKARVTIVQNLQNIDEECLGQSVTGPRLVPIPDGTRTMFLVFGSGIWNWRQLLDSDADSGESPKPERAASEQSSRPGIF